MARRVLGFAGILTLSLYGITAGGASPALAARQRTARTTTTTAPVSTTADAPVSTTTTTVAKAPPTTTTTTAAVTRPALTAITPAFLAPDGSGTMDATPESASAASLHNTLDFTYQATGSTSNGAVTLTVPTNWSAPSLTGTQPGYTTTTAGTLTISNRTITVSGLTLNSSDVFTIRYGNTSLGGPGATAPSSPILQTWIAKEKSTAGGVLTNLATQPEVLVTAKDGAGTATTPTKTVVSGSTGNTITFTYTAPTGGLSGGQVVVLAPTGWAPPSVTSTDPSYSTASAGSVSVFDQGVIASNLTMGPGQTLTITYGNKTGGGPGATAPSTTGPQTWRVLERSSPGPGGSLKDLAPAPSITVVSDSTTVVDTTAVSASSIHNTLTFTYTAPTGGLTSGAVTLTVPAGWSAPSVSGSQLGYSTASMGTLTVSTRTITVSNLTLAAGNTFTIIYGSRSLGGAGATAPTAPIVQTWPVSEKATSGGTLVPAASPSVTVTAKDGTGTVTTPTKNVSASSTGNTIVFTFTSPAGGVTHGEVEVTVPSGWSNPSTTSTDPGYFTASGGTTFTDGPRMGVIDFNLPAGQTLTITYGDKTGGGPGATAPSTPVSLQKWQAAERSSLALSGAIKNLLTSPTITVNGADGGGTITITSPAPDPDPTSTHQLAVRSGSSGNTIVFTFKAPAGGVADGAVSLAVPADWTPPSLTPTDAGYIKPSLSGVGALLSGHTVTVSHVTLSAGSSFTITYGLKTSGGPGATAPMIAGSESWPVQERSTAGGTLADLGASPVTLIPTHNIEPNGSHGCNGTLGGGSGTFCFMPNQFSTTTGGTVTFANFSGSTHDVDRCTPDVCNGVGPGTGGDANFGGSPDLHPGFQYSVTFNGTPAAAGTYNYRCSIHGYAVMHGTITVS